MMKSFLLAASCGLFISSSASAVGWGCTDQTGRFWQFTATGFNNGVVTASDNGGGGMNGNYSEFSSKIHWAMNVGGSGYSCTTSDNGSGYNFNCSLTYGNGYPGLTMSNCNAIFFFGE